MRTPAGEGGSGARRPAHRPHNLLSPPGVMIMGVFFALGAGLAGAPVFSGGGAGVGAPARHHYSRA